MTIAQQRASLYDSFATLYAREIGRETLSRLTDPNAAWPFLQALSVLEPDAFARLQVALSPIAALAPAEALQRLTLPASLRRAVASVDDTRRGSQTTRALDASSTFNPDRFGSDG